MTFKRIAIPAGLGCSAMSPRTRVVAIVAVAAAVAAGGTVGGTLLQTRGETSGTTARKGFPPLDIPASPALRLYRAGKLAQAEALFSRSHDLPDEIGAAFARWPHGTLDDVKKLVAANPQSGLAELHLGLAYYWSGRDADAVTSWRNAARLEPGSPSRQSPARCTPVRPRRSSTPSPAVGPSNDKYEPNGPWPSSDAAGIVRHRRGREPNECEGSAGGSRDRGHPGHG